MPGSLALSDHFAEPGGALRSRVRRWDRLMRGAIALALVVALGSPILLVAMTRIGALHALLGMAFALVLVVLLWWIWHGLFRASARAAFFRSGLAPVLDWAGALPGVRRVHVWHDDLPGVVAVEADSLWLCCRETGFAPLRVGYGGLRNALLHRDDAACHLGIICRPDRYGGAFFVAIPFAQDEGRARHWLDDLRPFLLPPGATP